MLKNKPTLPFCGLTVILSNPSRFDTLNLLSANGGTLFNSGCLRPEYNVMQCDVRLMHDPSPLLPGTKVILLLGEEAMHKYCPTTKDNTLNEMRGSVLDYNGIPAIASYLPQEAADVKNYEQQINKDSMGYSADGEVDNDDEDGEEGDVKSHSPTKRSNYFFWLKRDVWKCKQILNGKMAPNFGRDNKVQYRIYPSSDEIINILTNTKGQFLYFDIETDWEEQNLLCFAFSFDGNIIYSVPILDNNYHWAYSNVHFIMRALAICVRDNVVVAHNGAGFDFLVLAMKYRIPIVKTYDTMLAMHRCFPDVEKSLGHFISYFTWLPFHKDTDSRGYMTREHMMEKLRYCGRDVFGMAEGHKALTEYAKTIPGLPESIQCAMDSIRPYLTITMQGIKYDETKIAKIMSDNDALMEQYLRIIGLLIGQTSMDEIKKSVKGKAKAFPGSNTQCCKYFHEMLGYPTLFTSKKTGKPSLGKKMMYKLALKYENPVITFTLLYRQLAKETGSMKFNAWRDNENNICPSTKESEEIRFGSGLSFSENSAYSAKSIASIVHGNRL